MVVAEERPRISLTQSFSKIFKDLGLSPRAVSTTFGCRVNVAICLQVRRRRRRVGELRKEVRAQMMRQDPQMFLNSRRFVKLASCYN